MRRAISQLVNPQIRRDRRQPVRFIPQPRRRAQNIHQDGVTEHKIMRLACVLNLSATRKQGYFRRHFSFVPSLSQPVNARFQIMLVLLTLSLARSQDECKLCNGPWEMRDGAVYKSSSVSTLAVIKSSRRLSSSPFHLAHTRHAQAFLYAYGLSPRRYLCRPASPLYRILLEREKGAPCGSAGRWMDGWSTVVLLLSLFLLGGVFLYFLCRRERKSKRRFDMCFSF